MEKSSVMKKFLWIVILLCFGWKSASAQNAALGDRVSEIKSETWLGGIRPTEAPTTVILFFSVSNPACITSLERLHAFVEKSDGRLRVIVVTRDDEARVAPVATPYLSERMAVAFDTDGKIYKNFGVNYVPFALLTDARNRVLWQGNSLQLNETTLSTAR